MCHLSECAVTDSESKQGDMKAGAGQGFRMLPKRAQGSALSRNGKPEVVTLDLKARVVRRDAHIAPIIGLTTLPCQSAAKEKRRQEAVAVAQEKFHLNALKEEEASCTPHDEYCMFITSINA